MNHTIEDSNLNGWLGVILLSSVYIIEGIIYNVDMHILSEIDIFEQKL